MAFWFIGQTFAQLVIATTWAIRIETKLARIEEQVKILRSNYNG